MFALKLILKNALRHRLRTTLTVLGLVVATLSFGLLQTVINAWYAGAEAASNTRLITRNAISLVFQLPLSYSAKIRNIEGVNGLAHADWFGGIYQEPRNFFPQFAVSGEAYLNLYPEYRITKAERDAFVHDRKSCIVGRKLANEYDFKIGDIVPLKGTLYPGNWEFVVRGIYDGRDANTDTSQFFFHWDYLNETLKKTAPRRANQAGVYIVQISNPDRAAAISLAIDQQFKNSLAETLTETENAFQLSFVSMSETIILAIRIVSFVVIVIIMAVMANTMAMSARERLPEYATMKALGFTPRYLALLIFGESFLIATFGAALGIALLFPSAALFSKKMGTLFPTFEIALQTMLLQALCGLIVGLVAGITPAWRTLRINIVDGLRSIG